MAKHEVNYGATDERPLCGYNARSMRALSCHRLPRRGAGALLLIGLVLSVARPAATAARAASLRWPLESIGPIQSSFGEYRYDHLHAGLDISTGGRTGLKVLAAADGEIFRLKVEWRGYGRALYLRHPGGRVTVYGHLERYEDRVLGLERLVARRQAAAGTRYPGDVYLDRPVRVARGQVIAYSGESGVGLPHLHFEVRDAGDAPVDPFQAGLPRPPDKRPPVLESLIVTAADSGTFIDGDSRESVLPLKSIGGRLTTVHPVQVNGPFLAALSAYDPAGESGRAGVGALAVSVDGREIYRYAPHTFRFDQYPQAGLVFEHRYSRLSPAAFAYRLYRLPGNDLASEPSGVVTPRGDVYPGALDLEPGSHWLDITVDDAGSNRSRCRVCVLVGRPRAVETLERQEEKSGAAGLRFRLSDDDGRTARSSPAAESPGCSAPPRGVEGEYWDERERAFKTMTCRLEESICPLPGRPEDGTPAVRLRETRDGVPGPWRLLAAPPASAPLPGSLAVDVETWPGALDILTTLESPQTLEMRLASGPAREPIEPLSYRDGLRDGAAVAYAHAVGLAPFSIVSEASRAPLATLALDVLWVEPGRSVDYNGPGFSLHLPEKARFFPGPLVLRTERTPGADSLPSMSDAVDVLPDGEALDDRAALSFDLSPGAVPPEALGVYRWDTSRRRWSYEGGDLEEGNTRLTVRFRRYGRFAMLQDASPPSILGIVPAPGSRTTSPRPALSARVEDIGKGLNFDGVIFELDGRRLESEFDPDRGVSRVLDPPRLAAGRHHLKVVAVDLAGNSSPAVEGDFVIASR